MGPEPDGAINESVTDPMKRNGEKLTFSHDEEGNHSSYCRDHNYDLFQ